MHTGRITFSCLLTLAPFVSSADTLAKAKHLTLFYSVAPLLKKWFTCHHSTPYFFISLFPTAFYRRSRMTGKYILLLCKKLFFPFCSLLPLPTAGAVTLANAKRLTHFYSVAPLLEKWFACFPTSRGRFTVRILFFLDNKSFTVFRQLTYIKTMNSFSLVVRFPRTRREVPSLRGDRGKLAYTGQNIIEKPKAPLPSFLSGGSMRMSRTEPQRDE